MLFVVNVQMCTKDGPSLPVVSVAVFSSVITSIWEGYKCI